MLILLLSANQNQAKENSRIASPVSVRSCWLFLNSLDLTESDIRRLSLISRLTTLTEIRRTTKPHEMDVNLCVEERRKKNLHKRGGAFLRGKASPVQTNVENKIVFIFLFLFLFRFVVLCLSHRKQAVLLCAFTVFDLRTFEQKQKRKEREVLS